MKRILCISALTIFLCSCSGDTGQQATNIQVPPPVGANTPPVKSDEAESMDSEMATNNNRPPGNEPAETPDSTSPADEGVERPDLPDNPVSDKPNDSNDTPDAAESNETVRPANEAREPRGEKPKAAEMFAAFPSPSGTVGLSTGNLIPEISGTDIEGVDFKLSDYQGKVIMLDFWGDW